MTAATQSPAFEVGDRVTSIYGHEHVGTVVEVGALKDGRPLYHVERDSDGFVWIGLTMTTLPAEALN